MNDREARWFTPPDNDIDGDEEYPDPDATLDMLWDQANIDL